jgi:hypothetical protein
MSSYFYQRLEIRESPLHGRGTFARAPIATGDIVVTWEHRVLSSSDATTAPRGTLLPRSDGTAVWLPPVDPDAVDELINHSCDPNVWMLDEVTLATRRHISAGEELRVDYGLFELNPEWVCRWGCQCGSPLCRGVITGHDWQIPALQERYGEHFHPILVARIQAAQRKAD